jgi:hypothetical protein
MFGKMAQEIGLGWHEYRYIERSRTAVEGLLTFAYVATHNHFAQLSVKAVTNQHATVIKCKPEASQDDRFAVLGLLNSSLLTFWLKQVIQPKQMTAGDGVRIESVAKVPHEYSATQVSHVPLPLNWNIHPLRPRLSQLAMQMHALVEMHVARRSESAIATALRERRKLRELLDEYQHHQATIRQQMVFLQEEIDFVTYDIYGITNAGLMMCGSEIENAVIDPGERPFCIIQQTNQEGFSVPAGIPSVSGTMDQERRTTNNKSETKHVISRRVDRGRQTLAARQTIAGAGLHRAVAGRYERG